VTLRVRLEGDVPVARPPADAFALFTPSGETAWADGWSPVFPLPAHDETEPGTVFETDHDGHRTTWIVVQCTPGETITYARISPTERAGLVDVACRRAPDGTTVARVRYDLTALSADAERSLDEFAARFAAFLDHWRLAIEAAVTSPRSPDVPAMPD
jgi:hypothetical protein